MSCLILRGRRCLELQKYRHLRVSVQNAFAFSTSPTSAASVSLQHGEKGQNFAVSYLVKSLGLPAKLSESISKKISIEEKGNPESVLNLLRSHGFTDSQISSIVTDYPRLLIADAEKSLAPKLQFLKSRGASTSEFTEVVSKVPKILGKKGDITISRYYDFVKEVIEADKCSKFRALCQSSLPQGHLENKVRNLSVLRELGVPQKTLFGLLFDDYSYIYGRGRFEESLKKVVEMGFDATTPKFVQALRMVYQLSDKTIDKKVNAYKRLGFAEEDVWKIFKKCPLFFRCSEKKITQAFETLKKCGLLEDEILSLLKRSPFFIAVTEQRVETTVETFLGLGFTRDEFLTMAKHCHQCFGLSAETVKKKTEFLMKTMNWSLKAVVANPAVFGYNLEKRTVPRCYVIKALMSKGLLGPELPSLGTVLVCTDKVFLKRYVMKHDPKLVLELMSIFTTRQDT